MVPLSLVLAIVLSYLTLVSSHFNLCTEDCIKLTGALTGP